MAELGLPCVSSDHTFPNHSSGMSFTSLPSPANQWRQSLRKGTNSMTIESVSIATSSPPMVRRHKLHSPHPPKLTLIAVFLAKPRAWDDEQGIEIYPTAKLGDFGLVIFTGPKDRENPSQYIGVGTSDYMALVSHPRSCSFIPRQLPGQKSTNKTRLGTT